MAGVLTSLLATSCAQEDIPVPGNGEYDSFTVSLPAEMGSRAFGDGLSAQNLYVAVFEEGNTTALISNFAGGSNAEEIQGNTKFANGSLTTTINIQLVKGKKYDIVFFAENFEDGKEGNPYAVSGTTLTVDYAKMGCNSENYDAFYAVESFTSTGTPHDVTLNRPFAQVNIGTDDLAAARAAGLDVASAGVKFTNLPTTFDMKAGETGSATTEATFAATALPTAADGSFPVAGYDYMVMAYVLAGDGAQPKSTIDNVGMLLNADTETWQGGYANIPVQRNYRTNIYGSLLTNPENFTVTIDPAFGGSIDRPQSWNLGYEEVAPDADGNYTVANAAQMAWIAKEVNDGNNTFEGKTVTLTADLDLSGQLWAPVGGITDKTGSQGSNIFRGTFDGGNHTVSGVTATATGKYACAGFFGRIGNGATVRNVTIKDANIISEHYAAAVVAYVYNNAWTEPTATTTIENCKVVGGNITSNVVYTGTEWDNGDKAGGILAYAAQSGIVLNNNSVEGATITGYRHIGSIAGLIEGIAGDGQANNANRFSGSGNTADNVTLVQDMEHNYKNLKPMELISATANMQKLTGSISMTASNVNIEVKNYNNPDFNNPAVMPAYSTLSNNSGDLTLTNFNVFSLGVKPVANRNVTVQNSTIKSTCAEKGKTARIALFVAPGGNGAANGFSLTVRNNVLSNVDTNCLYVQGANNTTSGISITGNKFLSWGVNTDPADHSYFCVKIYSLNDFSFKGDTGLTFADLPKAGQEFVRSFFNGGNSWNGPLAGQGIVAMGDGFVEFNSMP